ncbi:nitrate- and nitrite sensing domain-containing protein [Asanoa sp. NPDC049573]|uniref:nitrate- and nitrite sensing domain-containing protein n=1 Tax=Asanoa sp. NPDC049573 TaxID=3155396 RepID=UPI00341EA878
MNSRSWSIRSKIISLVAVPIAALTALWIFATTLTLGPALSLLSAQGLLDDIGKPGENVVAALQQERRLSLVYLAGRSSPERLATQRAVTDDAISEFRRSSAGADTSDLLASRLQQLDQSFAVLPSGRDFIDRRDMDKAGALGLYNGVIDSAFRAFSVLVALPDEQLGREGRAVTSLGRAREVLARADALLGGVFAGDKFAAGEHGQLVQIIGTERYLYDSALADLPDDDRAQYTQLTEGAAFGQLNDMLDTLVSKGRDNTRPPVAQTAWQSSYDTVQHALREFELDASDRLADRAVPVATGILIRLALAGILGLIAVGIALYVSIRVGRGLIRRLIGLRATALELADERLPTLIGRLRRGQEVDVDAESPPLEYGSDELGQVGHAFAAVQRTAVRSAVDEAALRRGLSEVFLNIARRSQTLLHRQLALLDKMERRTTDPDELGDLFRVDHLATRMRRHAEDLVVLAGAAPGRGWRVPVPMIDVIRGAVSEVEDYPRVNIVAVEPAAVAGRAVADVIHLLAELIENATSFSPPHTKVHVAGQAVPNGYAIEIEDRGLGMPAEAIAEANQRLSEPPEFDPANSARLGLFVVAQLGARHGVRVQLRPSPYGGVTAVALLPTALIGAGTAALALPGREPADRALPAGDADAVLMPGENADDSPVWTVPDGAMTGSGDSTPAGAWSSSPRSNWPTALSGGLTRRKTDNPAPTSSLPASTVPTSTFPTSTFPTPTNPAPTFSTPTNPTSTFSSPTGPTSTFSTPTSPTSTFSSPKGATSPTSPTSTPTNPNSTPTNPASTLTNPNSTPTNPISSGPTFAGSTSSGSTPGAPSIGPASGLGGSALERSAGAASSAEFAAEPTPALGLPVQRRRKRPADDSTAELVVGEDGLPRRNRQRHLAPQLRRPVDDGESSGSFPAGFGGPTSPTSAPPAPRDPEEVRARMSALQAGTSRGRRESAAETAPKPIWTPPAPPTKKELDDATRPVRIRTDPAAEAANGASGDPESPHAPADGNGASAELPDRTEGNGAVTPPVPSEKDDDRSRIEDPSGKDA